MIKFGHDEMIILVP